MMLNRENARVLTGWLIYWVVVLVAACAVGVPTEPDIEIRRSQPLLIDEGAAVSVGPRRLLIEISETIEKEYRNIEVVDGLAFRDTAFPEGGWRLQALLEGGISGQLSEQINVDYLVLVGTLELVQGEEEGFLVPMLVGALSVEGSSTINAVIVDLTTGQLITRLECEARGTSNVYHSLIFVAGNEPLLGSGATEGLAKEIGKVITELGPTGTHRIAVLALEHPREATETGRSRADVLTGAALREQIYAHRTDEELRTAAEQGKGACEGEADTQLQRYFNLIASESAAAHHWLCKSADQGHPDARYRLALLYENGSEGLQKDLVKAYRWYVLAGESGAYWGGRHALRLEQEALGPDEVGEARESVMEWRPGQCEIEIGSSGNSQI